MPKQYKLGTTDGQRNKQQQLIVEAGIRSDRWQTYALNNGNFSVLVRAAAAGRTIKIGKRIPVYDQSAGVYRFDVDFDMQLDEMIEEGRYNHFDPNFTTDLFPIVGKGMIEFEGKLFEFEDSSSDVAESRIKSADTEHPWAPAPIAPFLGFGAAFPDLQRRIPILGLGSIVGVGGAGRIPLLSGDRDYGRTLRFMWHLVIGWHGICGCLGVRPALPTT